MTDIDLTAAKNAAREALETTTTWSPMHCVDVIVDAALPHILDLGEAHVKPTQDEIVRIIWTAMEGGETEGRTDGPLDWDYAAADAVLALLPGKTEQEVRAEIANISEEATMDLWWEACNDGWAVPDYLPLKYLKHVIRALGEIDLLILAGVDLPVTALGMDEAVAR